MADKLICFATLVSMAILVHAGSTPPDVTPEFKAAGTVGKCVYTVYVEIGSMHKAGTDSAITLALATANGTNLIIENLEKWGGAMGSGHNYFEAGSVDIFTGRGACLPSPPCYMVLKSDGSGWFPGWYCKSVEVTVAGPRAGCARVEFGVEQWLARDEPPNQLAAVRNVCNKSGSDSDDGLLIEQPAAQ